MICLKISCLKPLHSRFKVVRLYLHSSKTDYSDKKVLISTISLLKVLLVDKEMKLELFVESDLVFRSLLAVLQDAKEISCIIFDFEKMDFFLKGVFQ